MRGATDGVKRGVVWAVGCSVVVLAGCPCMTLQAAAADAAPKAEALHPISGRLPADRWEELRMRMVESQIEHRGIRDEAVLEAMRRTPRHLFVPEGQVGNAYHDRPLPIGYGQTISQPYIVAFMTEIVRPQKDFKVLEIGAGSGYQAAVLAELVDHVYTIEIVPELARWAQDRLGLAGYTQVTVRQGDGYHGWPEEAPFDAIVVTAASPHIPPPLIAQLKEGGRMIIPVGTPFRTQHLVLVEKTGDGVRTRQVLPVQFVPFTRSQTASGESRD